MISLITPTYNRGKTLTRLYESLKVQKNFCFEWVIIDDGSADDTSLLVASFISESSPFEIKYFRQENSGKHIALNSGLLHSVYDFIFIVDSDDMITPDCIETILKNITHFDNESIAGICFRKSLLDYTLLGPEFTSTEYLITTPNKISKIINADLAYVFRRSLMELYPFPKFKNEKFVPELLIWNKISDHGDIVFFLKKTIYLCEYLDDGYTKNFSKVLRTNPLGFLIFYSDQVLREKSLKFKLKNSLRTLQCFIYYIARLINAK